ncbi:hypothetical protein BROUX41_001708 [Berkeleyomyces rouxiae]|uniref:uncharacterized protein n=1 Tax=Berkeleyomyces rouxiae TaxID=2035830 RepID=UPI003B7F0442
MPAYEAPSHVAWTRAVPATESDINADSSFVFNVNSTHSVVFFNEFIISGAKSMRSATMVLAAFNLLTAVITIIGLLLTSWVRSRRQASKLITTTTYGGSSFVCLPEVFPLVLSVGITAQAVIFMVSQSLGLRSTTVLGCTITSQAMFPAIFIVPYIQMVFGINEAYIALRSNPFSKRGKWNLLICVSVILVLLLAKYVVAVLVRPPNFCFAFLYWFVLRWGLACFIITIVVLFSLVVSTVIVFYKLRLTTDMDPEEQVTAATMVYYMLIGILTNFLFVPFFYSIGVQGNHSSNDTAVQLSLVSAVVANISGILTGGLHLYLRSKFNTTMPRPIASNDSESKVNEFKRTRDSGYAGTRKIQSGYAKDKSASKKKTPPRRPVDSLKFSKVPFAPSHQRATSLPHKSDPVKMLPPIPREDIEILKMRLSTETLNQNRYSVSRGSLKPLTSTDEIEDLLPSTIYKPSPNQTGAPSLATNKTLLLPVIAEPSENKELVSRMSTTAMPSVDGISSESKQALLAPPPYGTISKSIPEKPRHARNSSLGSLNTTATVKIGLRLSNVDGINSQYFHDSNEVYSINYDVLSPAIRGNLMAALPNKPSQLGMSPMTAGNPFSPGILSQQQSPDDDDYTSRCPSTISNMMGFNFIDINSPRTGLPTQPQLRSPISPVAPLNLATLNSMVYDPYNSGKTASHDRGEDSQGVSPISPIESSIEIGFLASPRTAQTHKEWD